jgi:hypothetical protein
MDPVNPDVGQLNAIERLGVKFLRQWNALDQSRIQRWSPEQERRIRRLERGAIILAVISGTLSGALIGGLEIWLNWTMPDRDESWSQWLQYWGVFLGGTVLISVIEIVLLYWVVLHRVARITAIAGLRLSKAQAEEIIVIGLSRAALDIRDPQEPIYGIDPYRRTPRWKLILYAVMYRLKIGATSFVVRVLLRRVVARVAVRSFIPLAAIAIYALWNALIIRWAVRASRVRAAGPVAVKELSERLSAVRGDLDERMRRLILEAVAEAIVRSASDHPNFVLLLGRLFQVLEIEPGSLMLDWEARDSALDDVSPQEQELLLAVVTVTVMLEGKPRRGQRQFLQELHQACGREWDAEDLDQRFDGFFRGQGIGDILNPDRSTVGFEARRLPA